MRATNFLVCLFFIGFNGCLFNRISLECKVDVTSDYVFFDHCYNGLFIYELDVADSVVSLYPKDFKKIFAYELRRTDSLSSRDTKDLKIYFSRKNEHFQWKLYKYAEWGTGGYELKDVIEPFKSGKWYLFSFMNPHFEVFAYCKTSGEVNFVKKDLNANF